MSAQRSACPPRPRRTRAPTHIQRQVAVDVGDVQELLEEVGGDIALLLELLDGRRGALDGSGLDGGDVRCSHRFLEWIG